MINTNEEEVTVVLYINLQFLTQRLFVAYGEADEMITIHNDFLTLANGEIADFQIFSYKKNYPNLFSSPAVNLMFWCKINLTITKSTEQKLLKTELYTKGIQSFRMLNEILKFRVHCCCCVNVFIFFVRICAFSDVTQIKSKHK